MPLPEINQKLPEFSLPAVVKTGASFDELTLDNAALAGRPFVLFFYPKDATSGCTIEVCGFRELHDEFQKLGVQVVGVSRDKLSAHRRFIENQTLPYPLASDDGARLIDEWGLLSQGTMYGKPVTRVARTTFVVDKDGLVRRIFEKVTPAGHAHEVLEFVKSL
jgi:thioredoxin-dependent peroxiredoxin